MYKLPKLAYEYDALEPAISKEVMELHHQKHHQAYVDKLNTALEEADDKIKSLSIAELLQRLDELPETIRTTIRNNGGGHYNHSLFWEIMAPHAGDRPGGDILAGIEEKYGSFASFQEVFEAKATGLFGSGWVWLQPNLEIITSPNQDNPIMTGGDEPLMGLDVWEHAYYLDYKNVRADYIKNWWSVVNWEAVERRYIRQRL